MRALFAVVLVIAWVCAGSATAQVYPSRPIVMVVPFAAGGLFDVLGRILGARMSQSLGQQIVIENTTGAAGIIGTSRVANAAPDGHTFLFGSVGTHAYNQVIYRKLRYNAETDFTPVGLFAEQPMVLIVRKDFPANDLAEFIAHVKSNSGKIQFASAGVGSTTHLGCALLNAAIGVGVTHVPYRGGGPASSDLVAGHIDYMCMNIGAAVPLAASKEVRTIATLARVRAPVMSAVATAHEQGLIDFDVSTWNAFFLPKGAPAAVVSKLNAAMGEAIDLPAVQNRMHELGVTAVAPDRRSPEYLAKLVHEEIKRWAGPIKAIGIQAD